VFIPNAYDTLAENWHRLSTPLGSIRGWTGAFVHIYGPYSEYIHWSLADGKDERSLRWDGMDKEIQKERLTWKDWRITGSCGKLWIFDEKASSMEPPFLANSSSFEMNHLCSCRLVPPAICLISSSTWVLVNAETGAYPPCQEARR